MRNITLFARLKKPCESVSLEIYTDKLAESGRSIVREAYEEAKRLDHDGLNPEHALIAFANLHPEVFDGLLQGFDLDRKTILRELSTGPGSYKSETIKSGAMRIEESFRRLLSHSLRRAREDGRREIEAFDFLSAIFEDAESLPLRVFRNGGIDRDTVIGAVNRLVTQIK